MQHTNIEWVQNPDGTQGYTWNPITGCLNHVNGLCKGGGFPCYAYRLANGRLRQRYLANKNTATTNYDEDSYPFYPRFWPERLNSIGQPNDWGYNQVKHPKGIFVCDMSDLFGIGIPEEWTEEVLGEIVRWPEHRFYLLTKQPQNLIKWSPFPDNCYVGVTACNQKAHNEAVVVLAYIEANTKFISHEPLLEHISLHPPYSPEDAYDWDIIGSQTKPYRPPAIGDVQEIVKACDKAGVAVFLKDNLMPLIIDQPKVPSWSSDNKKLKQEMPRGER